MIMSKYTTKVIHAAGITALTTVFTVFSTGAFAASNGTSIVNSGDNARVETESEYESSIGVTNSNTAVVTQGVTAGANTGGNSANRNIGATSMTTGAATVGTTLGVEVNHNTTGIDVPNSNGGVNLFDMVNTGNNADVEAEVEIENAIGVNNANLATTIQSVDADATTGDNAMRRNIGPSTMATGNAAVGTNAWVDANHNTTAVGLGGSNGALLNDTMITNTGDDATVETEAESETSIRVRNSNVGSFTQMVLGDSNTGYNRLARNIGATGLSTGNAGVSTSLGVEANHNLTGIGGSALSPAGVNLFDLVNTGDDFDGEAESETELQIAVSNGNSLWSLQSLMVNSNTGYSNARRNVGSSLMMTGAGAVGSSLYSGGNHNTTLMGVLGSLLGLLAM